MPTPWEDRFWAETGAPSDRTYPSSGWEEPNRVWLDGHYLVPDFSSGSHHVDPGRGMLSQFIALADATEPERFLEYARRWGLLTLCRHGAPLMHAGPRQLPIGGVCETFFGKDWDHREPIETWRRLARAAAAIRTDVAKSILARDPDDADWWRRFYPELGTTAASPDRVAKGIRAWLTLGAVRPRLVWPADADNRWTPSLVFTGMGLFGALAVQLLLVVWRQDQISPCREPGCPALAEMRGRVKVPYCGEHRARAIAENRSARWRDSHPGYYSKAQRDERAAKPYVTGRRRRAASTP